MGGKTARACFLPASESPDEKKKESVVFLLVWQFLAGRKYRSNVFLPASYAVTGKKNHRRIFSSNLRSAHPMIATRYPLMSVDPRKWVGTPALCSFACNRSL